MKHLQIGCKPALSLIHFSGIYKLMLQVYVTSLKNAAKVTRAGSGIHFIYHPAGRFTKKSGEILYYLCSLKNGSLGRT